MGRELDLRRTPPVPLQQGWEWWVDYPHRLSARVRQDSARGQVVELGRWELAPGLHGSIVRRLKPRPPAWQAPALIGSGAALVALAGLALLAEVWPALLAAGTVWALVQLLRFARGHRAACVGLHCPGCRE